MCDDRIIFLFFWIRRRLSLIHTSSNNNFDEPDLEKNAYATKSSAFLVIPADCVSAAHSCVDHTVPPGVERETFFFILKSTKKSTPWAYRPPIDGPCQLQGWHFRPNLRLEFSLACSCFSLASSCEREREYLVNGRVFVFSPVWASGELFSPEVFSLLLKCCRQNGRTFTKVF